MRFEPEHGTPAPTAAWFDGIITGSVDDLAALRSAVDQFNSVSPVRATLDLDGGRFTFLIDDRLLRAGELADGARAGLEGVLQQVVEAASRRGPIESTLRCTQVRAADVVETLFGVVGGSLKTLSRTRARTHDDDARVGSPKTPFPTIRISRAAVLKFGGLFLLAFLLLAWQSGYVDRLLAPRSEALATDAGYFTDVLAVEVRSEWGEYKVTLARGARYPTTTGEIDRLLADATSPSARAAMQAVANGDAIYVRIEDRERKVLEEAKVELRPLLKSADAHVKTTLHGRMAAHGVSLDLESGFPAR